MALEAGKTCKPTIIFKKLEKNASFIAKMCHIKKKKATPMRIKFFQ